MIVKERSYYIRNPRSVIITGVREVLLIDSNGVAFRFDTKCSAGWSQLMQDLTVPLTGSHLKKLSASITELDDDLWEKLIQTSHLLEADDGSDLIAQWEKSYFQNNGYHFLCGQTVCDHLIFACSGSVVSGFMAPVLLSLSHSRFQQKLDVILTHTAQKFITRDLLESYGIQTWCDPFERKNDIYVPHIHLGKSASCIVVMPASANAIHRIAHATCSDLLSSTIIASNAVVVIAPSMNEAMWNHPAVQNNIEKLRQNGAYILEPTTAFAAADFSKKTTTMYGGHGILWSGPASLINALVAVLRCVPGKGQPEACDVGTLTRTEKMN